VQEFRNETEFLNINPAIHHQKIWFCDSFANHGLITEWDGYGELHEWATRNFVSRDDGADTGTCLDTDRPEKDFFRGTALLENFVESLKTEEIYNRDSRTIGPKGRSGRDSGRLSILSAGNTLPKISLTRQSQETGLFGTSSGIRISQT
jgi:hypothetical protein